MARNRKKGIVRKTYKLATYHPSTKIPAEVKKPLFGLIAFNLISSAIFDLFSFTLKGSQYWAGKNTFLCLVCLVLYFSKDVLNSVKGTFYDLKNADIDNLYKSLLNGSIIEIVDATRDKVYKDEKLLTTSDLIFGIKEYISLVHNLYKNIPTAFVDTATMFVMTASLMLIEFNESKDIKLTLTFFGILLICATLYVVLLKVRINQRNKYRKMMRQLRKNEENFLNDLKNLIPIEKKDFNYHANKFKDCISNNIKEKKSLNLEMNINFLLRSLVLLTFMMLIAFLKLKGKPLTATVILDVVATTSVYDVLLRKIQNILSNFENILDITSDMEVYFEEYKLIVDCYDREIKLREEELNSDINNITISPFSFSYTSNGDVFKLTVSDGFSISTGNIVLVNGHTGCGKSTIMKLLTGKIKLENSPVSFKNTSGYLNSIVLEARSTLGCNSVLNEIVLDENADTLNCNFEKLLYLLKELTLFDDILIMLHANNIEESKKDSLVLRYLRKKTFKEFSTGQQQRLLITKVLYNLKDQQIIAFDEVTSGLDDATATKVLKFICNYCQADKKRIILFATHQVALTRSVCDTEITFHTKAESSEAIFSQL